MSHYVPGSNTPQPGEMQMDGAKLATIGNKIFQTSEDRVAGIYPASKVQKALEHHDVFTDNNMDARGIDVSMEPLMAKYAKEFAAADKHIEARKDSWTEAARMRIMYDYENDKRFQEWVRDKEGNRDALHIHPLDEWLDQPQEMLQTGAKVFTTLGMCYGFARSARMWRTIDQTYSKLHGVGLGSIMITEVCNGILGGAAVGAGFAFGNMTGDNLTRVVMCVLDDTVQRPRRQWQNIMGAFAAGGFFGGCVMCGFGAWRLAFKGHAMLLAAHTAAWTAVGSYLGVMVYKPWTKLYPESYDESPLPWHLRQLQLTGQAGIRGRYH